MFIAEDLTQFKKLFVSKLKAMLSDDELGAFILVLANSHQDAFLKNELDADLKSIFIELKNRFTAGAIDAAPDDADVFRQLLELDIDDIPLWQNKAIGAWEVVYNPMRQMRPARASSQVLDSIDQPFDENSFHFNKPFLKPEVLWEGVFDGLKSRVLYNKFPFSDYHLLIVLSPEGGSQQLLTKETHEYAFSLVQDMNKILPGFGIGFNSLAAGASVNHFHFQGFVREQAFPIEDKQWQHNGGETLYPLMVKRFTDTGSSWEYIEQLTGNDVAFNCLYRNNACYVVPRKYLGSVELPEWLTGAGWIDVAGVVTVSDEATFSALDEPSVSQALRLISLDKKSS